MPGDAGRRKRSLILAGGGLKVAFQAGVLQVWMDEAGIEFDHADGASGGCFNLAMWCQGMSGRQIADNWRGLDPLLGADLHWSQFPRLLYARSLLELGAYREKVFPRWGLDWGKIRASKRDATFNVYNFTRHELAVLTPDRMTEDFLVAGVSLPIWFPPVSIGGDTYIDSVFNTDANLEAAIGRGADELWVIWTVSQRGEWRDGFVANYFQIIETAANGRYKQVIARIDENNRRLAAGQPGEFGRAIEVKELKAEVPVHYLLNLSQDRLAEAVNRGVKAAREWCAANQVALARPGEDYPTEIHTAATKLRFSETMTGYVGRGETDFQRGHESGSKAGTILSCHLTIRIEGVNRFIVYPDHEAVVEGTVVCDLFGGARPIESGSFNLLVDEGDPTRKKMLYRLHFKDAAGQPFTLSGFKDVKDDSGFDLWSDTSTLYTRVLRGEVAPEDEAAAPVVAAGIIRIRLIDFLKQLTTFRVEGPTLADRTAALGRFGRLFLGKLWDVYAREVLATGG